MNKYKTVVELQDFERYLDILEYSGEDLHEVSSGAYTTLRPFITSLKDFIKPHIDVRMLVTLRTDITNEVLVDEEGKFFWEYSEEYPNQHLLDDVVLLSAKAMVDDLFKYMNSINVLSVIQRSAVYPVGSFIHSGEVYVYVNLVIDSNLVKGSFFKIKEGYQFIKIEDLTCDYLGEKLKSSLALVKEG